MKYDIIPMTADHLDQVAEIEQICFSDPWSRRMLSEHLENECAATLVALSENGTVLGYAGLLVVLDEGYINNIAVEEAARKHGVASALLDCFVRFAAVNLAFLTLEVRKSNAPAIALYEKYGFQQVGVRPGFYSHPREDAIIMTREFENDAE